MERIGMRTEKVIELYRESNVSERRQKNAQEKKETTIPMEGTFSGLTFKTFTNEIGEEVTYPLLTVVDAEGKEIGSVSVGRITDQCLVLDKNNNVIPVQVKNKNSKYYKHWFLKSESFNKQICANRSEVEIVSELIGCKYKAEVVFDQKVQKIEMLDGKVQHLVVEKEHAKKCVEVKNLIKFTLLK